MSNLCALEIVKVFWTPQRLATRLAALGWEITVDATEWAFIHGHGRRAKKDRSEPTAS